MFGGVALYALVNLVVVVPVVSILYLACIFIDEHGGYNRYQMPVLGTLTGLLGVVTIVTLGFYGKALTDVADKIDGIAVGTENFPSQVKDCSNSTELTNLFQHYGFQATAQIAGDALRAYEAGIVTILILCTVVPSLFFWLASLERFGMVRRWRMLWFGFYNVLVLEIFCFIAVAFYDLVKNGQAVMKDAGGIVDQALRDCDELWEALVVFSPDLTPQCTADIKKEMCLVHVQLKSFVDDNLFPLFASTMSASFLLPLLTLALGLGVFFTWRQPKGQSFEMRNRRYTKVASSADW